MDVVIKIGDGYIATTSDQDLRLVFHLEHAPLLNISEKCYLLYMTKKDEPIHMGWDFETQTFSPGGHPIIVSQRKGLGETQLFPNKHIKLVSPDLSHSYGNWYMYVGEKMLFESHDQNKSINLNYQHLFLIFVLLIVLIIAGFYFRYC